MFVGQRCVRARTLRGATECDDKKRGALLRPLQEEIRSLLDAGFNRIFGAFIQTGEHGIRHCFAIDELDHHARG